jgi:hypothetical protein
MSQLYNSLGHLSLKEALGIQIPRRYGPTRARPFLNSKIRSVLSSVFRIFSKIFLDPVVSCDDVGKFELLAGQSQGGSAMERRFLVEAKAFCFTAKEGSTELRLEERRKGFIGSLEWVCRVRFGW